MSTVIINTMKRLGNGHVKHEKHEVDGGKAHEMALAADNAIIFSHGEMFIFMNGESVGREPRFEMTVTRPGN